MPSLHADGALPCGIQFEDLSKDRACVFSRNARAGAPECNPGIFPARRPYRRLNGGGVIPPVTIRVTFIRPAASSKRRTYWALRAFSAQQAPSARPLYPDTHVVPPDLASFVSA